MEKQKTEFEKMMDEIAAIIEKHGYCNLGYQQTLPNSGEEVLRFIENRTLIDVVTSFDIDDETYELVMQVEEDETQEAIRGDDE